MSGTSLDGMDAAVIETDSERILDFGPTFYRPYKDEERAVLRHALAERLKLATVETADQAGFSADALERRPARFSPCVRCAACRSPSRPPAARRGRCTAG
jgi:1,6-anhydro-N-acetylmuramate kinase